MAITIDGKINPDDGFYGDKTILVAKTGYGKSYTARVIIEEGIKKNHSFIVIDPQDAYKNLDDFSYIDAADVKSAKGLGMLLAKTNKNVVISTKNLILNAQQKFLQVFLRSFKQNIRRGIQTLVIDEIHKYAPEGQNTICKDDVRGLFQESRSDGLGIIGITQRPQRLDKTCLAQAEHFGVGRVTAHRDKESIKTYMDNPSDVEKLPKLNMGEFLFFGFGHEEPIVATVRKSETEHSGNSPKNILSEDKDNYNKHASKYVKITKGNTTMTDKDIVKNVIPSYSGFKDLAMLGMKGSLGAAASGIVGNLVASRVSSPIPYISSRTLGSAASTVALYAGYRMIPVASVKDIMKYAAAGSAAYTAGSLAFDLVALSNIKLPEMVSFGLSAATGVTPMSGNSKAVDTDTALA